MSESVFRLSIREPDGSTGLVELSPAMAEALYKSGLRVLEDLGHEVGTDYQGGSEFLSIEWDDSLTEVTLSGYRVSTEAAAEVLSLGLLTLIADFLKRDE